MARRDFRQFGLADSIVRRRGERSEWLDQLDAALDWPALETIVAGIYASREGGLAYPLLTYVKLLLLQQWYGLSDEGLEAAVDDRLSFLRFAGIPLAESVPDHSSVWRFREQLARRGLAARLLAEVNRQLDAKGLILRRGTLIDATILEAAVRPPGGDAGEVSGRDPQAGWTRKNGRSRFGYKAHAAVDEGSGIVREAVMTPADVHDSVPADDLVQGDEGAVYADKAYDSEARRAGLRARGIEPRIMHKARRNRPLKPWQVAFNKAVAPIRAGVERLFGTVKRAYGHRRVRYLGLARNDVQLQAMCAAINLRRALALGRIPDPRRRQGRRYPLAPLLLFSVLAVLAGATSYRGILVFIAVHRERLNAVFGAALRRAPAVNTLRALFLALDPAELEAAFRQHARELCDAAPTPGSRTVALDGKTLKRSFDHLNDKAAAHV